VPGKGPKSIPAAKSFESSPQVATYPLPLLQLSECGLILYRIESARIDCGRERMGHVTSQTEMLETKVFSD
jgi:hypothetical protein